MAHLTETHVEVQDSPDIRVVAFATSEGEVEFVDMGDQPTVEVDFEPVPVAEAASILGDVAEDIGTHAVQVAAGILADIDEDAMFEYFETEETDQIILADADGQVILEGEDAEEFRAAQEGL